MAWTVRGCRCIHMSIPFPDVPGLQWDFDYTVSAGPPADFTFNSLTGTLDLTQGGLSGIGFDKAGMTLKYWADGDWYFEAGLKQNFNGYGAYGDILLGNTKDMAPLQALDPVVADFLSGIHAFKGGYARVGVQGRIFDYGCLFRVSAGDELSHNRRTTYRHFEADVDRLDELVDHLDDLIDDMIDGRYGHIHGSTTHVRRLVANMSRTVDDLEDSVAYYYGHGSRAPACDLAPVSQPSWWSRVRSYYSAADSHGHSH